MTTDFGTPPLAEQNHALVDQRLKETRAAGGVQETFTIEWRGQPRHVEVIDIPVETLYYNPGTRRIRAQRSHDPARDRALDENPWTAESQDYLDYLLKALPADPTKQDPEFDVLLESLRDFKQNAPGLMTRAGVLVDGNTRRAALKKLGVASMRVGVLPESCTWEDINAVELSLQLRKEHRREYSYINRLLAIDEQVTTGRPVPDIARDFRIKTATCEQDIWILSALRDLIARSKDGNIQLRLMDFEDHQEKLRELHRRYQKESANKSHADLLKENRFAAIALGFSKTDVRLIEPDFRTRYLDQRLPDSLKAIASPNIAVVIPGLNRTVNAADSKVVAARELTNTILKAKAATASGASATAQQRTAATATISAAEKAFEDALAPAGKDARLRKRRQAAPDRINDACDDLKQCVTDMVLARSSNSLDEEAFDEAVVLLRDTLRSLAVESARTIKSPGDGVSWLIESTTEES